MPPSQEAGDCGHIYALCALLERSKFVYWKHVYNGIITVHGELHCRKNLCWVHSVPRTVYWLVPIPNKWVHLYCFQTWDNMDVQLCEGILAWVDARMGLLQQWCIHCVQNSCPAFPRVLCLSSSPVSQQAQSWATSDTNCVWIWLCPKVELSFFLQT